MQVDFGVVSKLAPQVTNLDYSNDGMLTHYGIRVAYVEDMGLAPMPTAGPAGSACTVVRIHGGITYKSVAWIAHRIGGQPVIPTWKSSDNEILVGRARMPLMPGSLPDGTKYFSVSGLYLYVLLNPPTDDSVVPIPASPLDATTQNLNLDPSQYVDYLVRAMEVPSDLVLVGFPK